MTDSKTATERLREMLDARGVEWYEPPTKPNKTWFPDENGINCCVRPWSDALEIRRHGLTPEQAIAATLKGELDSMPFCEQVDKWLHGGAPSECLECDEGKYAELKAATLGSGTLTAEQVRKAIFNGSAYASYDGSQYYANGIGMQAIADELNAALGGGECELYYGETDEGMDSWFTQCGGRFAATFEDGRMVHPKFCQLCGRKAVKR